MEIRDARGADASELGAVHVAAWRAAYRGLMPDAYLDGLSVQDRAEQWRRSLASGPPPDRSARLVAEMEGVVVGFIVVGPTRDDDASGVGEVYSLNVAPSAWGSGCGGLLVRAATRHLIEAGFSTARLWVHPDNGRARGFYEHHGWRATGEERDEEIHGLVVPEVRYDRSLVVET